MKALVKFDLNQSFQRPPFSGNRYLERGDEVEVIDAEYRGDELWYKLDDGQTWVDGNKLTLLYLSDLHPADKKQFYICYRTLDHEHLPIPDTAELPTKLYFAQLPESGDSNLRVPVSDWPKEAFVGAVNDRMTGLPENRKDVFVYLHGFDWQPSLKLDLPYLFVHGYMRHPENTVAKVLYFGWPSMGWRKKADDRSIEAGEKFTKQGFFDYFIALSKSLHAQGKTLNLIVHSFGLQFLNGMINPPPAMGDDHSEKIFDHVFLMAPDITHLSVQQKGVTLRNRFAKRKGRHFLYDLRPLKDIAGKIHIYHNSRDYLLYVSTQKFNGKKNSFVFDTKPDSAGFTADYRNLGNFGKSVFDKENSGLLIEDGFEFIDVQDLIEKNRENMGSPFHYPFRNLDKHDPDPIINALENSDYSGFDPISLIWKRHHLMTHHQYMFTCKPVVEDVLARLKGTNQLPVLEDLIV